MDDIETCNGLEEFILCGNKTARASGEGVNHCACLLGVDSILKKPANMVNEGPDEASAVPIDLLCSIVR